MNIPAANPGAFVRAHRAEIDAAIARVLDSGRYVLGPEVAAFEREFGAFIGAPHVVGVASGTEALWLALKAAGVQPGDEVITVSLTASATIAAIVGAGARPVFVDVCPDDLTLDPAGLARALTTRTRAIVPVHLYGQAARLRSICVLAAAAGVPVIEDCAQAHGARCEGRPVGTWGALGVFSFYPTKNLGAVGDGGAIVTGNADLAERLRELREYGWQERHQSVVHGWNSRLDELQAAVLRVRLRHLAADNARRAALAANYALSLSEAPVHPPPVFRERSSVWHQYVVRSEARDRLRQQLAAAGIATAIHYPAPVHRQPAYRQAVALPVTEQVCRRVLSLPIYPELTAAEQQAVITAVRQSAGV